LTAAFSFRFPFLQRIFQGIAKEKNPEKVLQAIVSGDWKEKASGREGRKGREFKRKSRKHSLG
jgi:hypothetical protein